MVLRGHAIECRINAEDPARGFLPSPGRITAYREPAGIGVRVDSAIRPGDEVSELYDPLVAKLIVHDVDRERARRRMLRALEEYVVEGTTTLVSFHRALLDSPCFVRGETCAGIVDSEELARRAQELDEARPTLRGRVSADGVGTRARVLAVELDGRRHEVRIQEPEPPWTETARRHRERAKGLTGGESDAVVSPMQGTVLAVEVADGDVVEAGAVVCVVEAMKMENPIVSHVDGVVSELAVAAGEQVAHGQVICVVRPAG